MAKVKRRITYENVNPFKPIYSATKIAEFIGIHRVTFHNHYLPDMKELGLVWQKTPSSKSSPWVTIPLFLALFFHYRAKQQAKERRHTARQRKRTRKEQQDQMRKDKVEQYKIKRGWNPHSREKKDDDT